MTTVAIFPKIRSVKPEPDKVLLVEFENGEWRTYDCKPLLGIEAFRPLEDESIFRCVRPDPHGYGVIWNEDIDLAESEIWLTGRPG